MSGSLDDDFAAALTLGEARNAYTGGTPANVALITALAGVVASLTATAAAAEAAVIGDNQASTAADLLATVDAAGSLAASRAALAELAAARIAMDRR